MSTSTTNSYAYQSVQWPDSEMETLAVKARYKGVEYLLHKGISKCSDMEPILEGYVIVFANRVLATHIEAQDSLYSYPLIDIPVFVPLLVVKKEKYLITIRFGNELLRIKNKHWHYYLLTVETCSMEAT